MTIYEKLIRRIYLPAQDKLANRIGCRLIFHYIPARYIQGLIRCEMTRTWKKAGLQIVRGQNHFTIGKIVREVSSRFDASALEYQSWLGAYSVQLGSSQLWTVKDYCKLAIADQNSWLGWYGDPNPFTTIDGWDYTKVGQLKIRGGYVGTLYKGGFSSHSDVGPNLGTLRFFFASHSLAALYNLANPTLELTTSMFIPKRTGFPYHPIDGRVYIGVFNIRPSVKVILYGNGVIGRSGKFDTFELLESEFIQTMKSCEIVEVD